MAKNIAIFGSTGSIGCSSLNVINALGDDYKVAALSAHSNVELLAEQVRKYQPKYAAVTNPECCDKFREIAGDYSGQILTGPASLIELGRTEGIDTIITAVVGAAGLDAVLSAAKAGKIHGVEAIVTGSVIKFGNIVSVTVKLIDTETAKIIDSADVKAKSLDELSEKIDELALELARE